MTGEHMDNKPGDGGTRLANSPEVMTMTEAAHYLRLSELGSNNLEASMRRLVYERGFPAVRIGRSLAGSRK